MRSLRMAICTSGEPVSFGCVRYLVIITVFCALARAIGDAFLLFSVSVPKEDTIPRPVCKAGPSGDLQPHSENVRFVPSGNVRFSGSREGLWERSGSSGVRESGNG